MILLQFLEPRDHDLLELSSIDICLPPKIPFFNCLNFYYLSQAQVPILQQLLIDQVYSDLTATKQTNKQTNKKNGAAASVRRSGPFNGPGMHLLMSYQPVVIRADVHRDPNNTKTREFVDLKL